MAATAAELIVKVTAKTAEFGSGMKKASKDVKDFRATALKLPADLAGLAKGVIGIQALAGGFDLAAVAVNLFKGNTEAATELLERLPMGLGIVVKNFNALTEAITGNDAAMKAASDGIKQVNSDIEQLKKSIKDLNVAPDLGALGQLYGMMHGGTAEGLGGQDQLAQLNFQNQNEIRKIQEDAAAQREAIAKKRAAAIKNLTGVDRDRVGQQFSNLSQDVDQQEQDSLAQQSENHRARRQVVFNSADIDLAKRQAKEIEAQKERIREQSESDSAERQSKIYNITEGIVDQYKQLKMTSDEWVVSQLKALGVGDELADKATKQLAANKALRDIKKGAQGAISSDPQLNAYKQYVDLQNQLKAGLSGNVFTMQVTDLLNSLQETMNAGSAMNVTSSQISGVGLENTNDTSGLLRQLVAYAASQPADIAKALEEAN